MKFLLVNTLLFAAYLASTATAQDNSTSSIPCATTADCGTGSFCSAATATATAGTCVALTCANWAAAGGGATTTTSNNLEDGEAACTAEQTATATDSTVDIAGDSFCGWDGSCYKYGSCDDWYKWGPIEFTSFDPSNPVELTCRDYSTGKDDNLNSVSLGCRPYQPGSKAPESSNYVHYFNQECTATPRGSDDFKCYQNKPGGSSQPEYDDFLNQASRLNPPSCDRDTYGGLTEQNLFWYTVMMRQIRNGETTNTKQGRDNTRQTGGFNPSDADLTLFSILESDDAVPPPPSSSSTSFPPASTGTPPISGDNSTPASGGAFPTTAAAVSSVLLALAGFFLS